MYKHSDQVNYFKIIEMLIVFSSLIHIDIDVSKKGIYKFNDKFLCQPGV
jgi:hypothetical protein